METNMTKAHELPAEVKPTMSREEVTANLLAWVKKNGPWNKGKKGTPARKWKEGKDLHYGTFHKRVAKKRGKANHCERCDVKGVRKYEWANISGNYHDVNDYIQLCVSCHRKFDNEPGRNTKKGICKMCGSEFHKRINSQIYCGNRNIKESCSYKRQLEILKIKYANSRKISKESNV